MNSIGKRSKLIVGLLVMVMVMIAPVGSASALAGSSTTLKFRDTFPFSFFNTCTGEVVSGVFSVKTTVHETIDAKGGIHFHFVDVFRGTAVGETSGIEYVGPQTDHESFHLSSNGALEDTFTLNFRFISKGSADNILLHLLFHVTITPSGEVTSELSKTTDTCRG